MMKSKSVAVALMATGCLLLASCSKEESLSQRTGSAVSSAAADFISGLGEGVDQKMRVHFEADASLATHGLTVTLGKDRGLGSNSAAVYVVSEKPFKGSLIAKALDAQGHEIGRSLAEVDLEADGATYVNFDFNKEMDAQLVRKYALAVR